MSDSKKRAADEPSESDAKRSTTPLPTVPKAATMRAMLQDRIWRNQSTQLAEARAFINDYARVICARLANVDEWDISNDNADEAEVELCACPMDLVFDVAKLLTQDYPGYVFSPKTVPGTNVTFLRAELQLQ